MDKLVVSISDDITNKINEIIDSHEEIIKRLDKIEERLDTPVPINVVYGQCQHEWEPEVSSTSGLYKCKKCGVFTNFTAHNGSLWTA